jgi:hypothetical protein
LLKEMAQKKVMVEICLTSGDLILGIEGPHHPLPTYIKYGVPVALATDDEGVSRSDMTHEYVRAVESYNFSYAQLKKMARESLEHSFLAGPSLWQEMGSARKVAACSADAAGAQKQSSGCTKFLTSSDRAGAQWELEREFGEFEKKF